jgi:hypothetical protein
MIYRVFHQDQVPIKECEGGEFQKQAACKPSIPYVNMQPRKSTKIRAVVRETRGCVPLSRGTAMREVKYVAEREIGPSPVWNGVTRRVLVGDECGRLVFRMPTLSGIWNFGGCSCLML